nr:hypothetical protein [Tanacetum cinerariifolium]
GLGLKDLVPVALHYDNKSAIQILANPVMHEKQNILIKMYMLLKKRLHLGNVVEGDRDVTIYEGASVEFSVTREGGEIANAVRSSRSGIVVYVHDTGDFGFIRPAGGGENIYVHHTNARFRLRIYEDVKFLLMEDEDPQVMS